MAVAATQTAGTRMPTPEQSGENGHHASTGRVDDASTQTARSRMPTLEDGQTMFGAEVEGGTDELTEARHQQNSDNMQGLIRVTALDG